MSKAPSIRGGAYRAEKASDGTWSLLDVEIFGETERMVRMPDGSRKKKKWDREWMDSAVAKAQKNYAETGHMRPAHYRHHEGGTQNEYLGLFLPKSVREAQMDGRQVPVVVADVCGLDEATYQRIKSRRLPFRSAETTVEGAPEITSLALLDHEPSHFPFPLTTVGEEVKAAFAKGNRTPLVYFTDGGTRTAQTQRFYVADEEKPKDDADENEGGDEGFPAKAGAEKEEKPKEGADAAGLTAKVDQILALLTKVYQQEMAEISAREGTEVIATMGNETTTTTPAGKDSEDTAHFAVELAKRDGQIAALEGKLAALESKAAEETAITAATKRLRGFAAKGGKTHEERARECFKAGGKPALDAFVDTVEKHGQRDTPEEGWDEDPDATNVAPGLEAFAAVGPEAHRLAREAAATFDALPDRSAFKHDRPGFIRHAVERAGYQVPANGSK